MGGVLALITMLASSADATARVGTRAGSVPVPAKPKPGPTRRSRSGWAGDTGAAGGEMCSVLRCRGQRLEALGGLVGPVTLEGRRSRQDDGHVDWLSAGAV